MCEVESKRPASFETTCAASGADSARQAKLLRQRMMHWLALSLCATLLACSPSPEEIGQRVLRGMQHRFATDPELSKLGIAITKVVVIKESGNKY